MRLGYHEPAFFKVFKDPIRVPRIENWFPRIRENYHRVPRIREIGSQQVHTGYLTFSLKKNAVISIVIYLILCGLNHLVLSLKFFQPT